MSPIFLWNFKFWYKALDPFWRLKKKLEPAGAEGRAEASEKHNFLEPTPVRRCSKMQSMSE